MIDPKIKELTDYFIKNYLTDEIPTPTPEPEPEPIPDPDGLIEVWKGETKYLDTAEFLHIRNPIPTDWESTLYSRVPVTTTNASWRDARIGLYADALKPVSEGDDIDLPLLRVDVPENIAPGVYGDFKVLDKTLDLPTSGIPYYMQLESYKCLLAYFKATGDSNNWAMQGLITKKYIDMYRSFGIEPFAQSISRYPSNLERDAWGGSDYSFKSLVLDEALYAPMIYVGTPEQPDREFLEQLSNPLEFYFYGIDEAGTGPSGMGVEDAVNRINYVADSIDDPGLDFVQTGRHWEQYESVNGIVRHVVPNVWANEHNMDSYGEYTSCMASGNCHNNSAPSDRTAFPNLLIEGHPQHDWERVIDDLYTRERGLGLYFNGTQNLTTCWEDGGLYNEGGNGDGTLCYYGPETGDPWPSVRMVHLHKAMIRNVKKRG